MIARVARAARLVLLVVVLMAAGTPLMLASAAQLVVEAAPLGDSWTFTCPAPPPDPPGDLTVSCS